MMKTIRKQGFLLLGILAIALNSFGVAGKYSIKGRVVDDDTKKPIEFASVMLIALPDSTIKSSALTDPQGNYSFANVAEGKFVVKAQIVGYSSNRSKSFASSPNTSVADIAIKPSAVIKEVTVVGKKPYIEKKADRTVLNIESSATASAESAYEVLKKAPNINIDKDDNININGKQGVTVMINDRPTHLSGTDLANYLKSVQGGEIEKVEIITTRLPATRRQATPASSTYEPSAALSLG
ncbi:carboxypeptidase regulatory-like domain-containing protein [uncultured Acetobacteroides sp.]|uniref:carboxypeptidase regulatory-like domain-containing protein n=1 Tax=uncultured Acetobacteroides sp. TaxID=1760811 RepID=UPI0029F46341|nr:carboxypeptidase regulatory-like domain-containing protein [uncultured Acetobacteroides sp.]